MSDPGIDLEQIHSGDRRSLLGVPAKPVRPVLTLDDFELVSDEVWRGSEYGASG